ncbi:ABC transporter substrate-binding protein, partial [Xanthomonas citri pv. citri]
VRVPIKATDFSPFLQAAKELRPDAIFIWFPGGPPATGIIRAYSDNGLAAAGIKLLGTGETY